MQCVGVARVAAGVVPRVTGIGAGTGTFVQPSGGACLHRPLRWVAPALPQRAVQGLAHGDQAGVGAAEAPSQAEAELRQDATRAAAKAAATSFRRASSILDASTSSSDAASTSTSTSADSSDSGEGMTTRPTTRSRPPRTPRTPSATVRARRAAAAAAAAADALALGRDVAAALSSDAQRLSTSTSGGTSTSTSSMAGTAVPATPSSSTSSSTSSSLGSSLGRAATAAPAAAAAPRRPTSRPTTRPPAAANALARGIQHGKTDKGAALAARKAALAKKTVAASGVEWANKRMTAVAAAEVAYKPRALKPGGADAAAGAAAGVGATGTQNVLDNWGDKAVAAEKRAVAVAKRAAAAEKKAAGVLAGAGEAAGGAAAGLAAAVAAAGAGGVKAQAGVTAIAAAAGGPGTVPGIAAAAASKAASAAAALKATRAAAKAAAAKESAAAAAGGGHSAVGPDVKPIPTGSGAHKGDWASFVDWKMMEHQEYGTTIPDAQFALLRRSLHIPVRLRAHNAAPLTTTRTLISISNCRRIAPEPLVAWFASSLLCPCFIRDAASAVRSLGPYVADKWRPLVSYLVSLGFETKDLEKLLVNCPKLCGRPVAKVGSCTLVEIREIRDESTWYLVSAQRLKLKY